MQVDPLRDQRTTDRYGPGTPHDDSVQLPVAFRYAGPVAVTAASVAVMTGLAVLTAWAAGWEAPKRIVERGATMKPNTALCFILTGTSLILAVAGRVRARDASWWGHRASRWASAAVILMGGLTILEYMAGLDLPVDRMLFPAGTALEDTTWPGRMAGSTAVCFVLLGTAQLVAARRPTYLGPLRQLLPLVAVLMCAPALICYLYSTDIPEDLRPFPYSTIAVHTAVLFAALGGSMALFHRATSARDVMHLNGSIMTRRLLPVVVMLPPLFGWLAMSVQHAGKYAPEFATALATALDILVLSAIVWFVSRPMNLADQRQRMAARQLQQTVRSLAASEARKSAILDSALDSIITTDADGRIEDFSPVAVETFGRPENAVRGSSLADLILPTPVRRPERDQLLRALNDSTSQLGQRVELTASRADGSSFPVEMAIGSARLDDQVLRSCFIRDITERKAAQRNIEESLREKEIMLREIHHRVKNNMQVISSILSLQSQTIDDEANRQPFRDCERRVRAMAMVHEMLYGLESLSTIEFSHYMTDLAKGVIDSLGAEGSHARLEVAAEKVELHIDYAIPLSLVINEVITNAIKHGIRDVPDGSIRLELRVGAAGSIELQVTNDGVWDARIEERDPTSPATLGLRIVRGLCRQLDAEWAITRTPEGCAQFRMAFTPAKAQPSFGVRG